MLYWGARGFQRDHERARRFFKVAADAEARRQGRYLVAMPYFLCAQFLRENGFSGRRATVGKGNIIPDLWLCDPTTRKFQPFSSAPKR